jgi:hypothetical protein
MNESTFIHSAVTEAIKKFSNVDLIAKQRYANYLTLKKRFIDITTMNADNSAQLENFAKHLAEQGISEFTELRNFSSEAPQTTVIPFLVVKTNYTGNGHSYGDLWVFFRADNLSPNVVSPDVANPGFTRNNYPSRDTAEWITPTEEEIPAIVDNIVSIWKAGTSPLAEWLDTYTSPLAFIFKED